MWSFTRLSIEEFLARNDTVAMPSAKRMRTPEGRRKYEAQLAVARSTARDRSRYVDGSLALVVVLVSVIGIGVQAGRAKIDGDVTAVNASVSHGVVCGKKAAATVDIYEDFGCPICEEFEKSTHALVPERRAREPGAGAVPHDLDPGQQLAERVLDACGQRRGVRVGRSASDEFIAYHNLLYGIARR